MAQLDPNDAPTGRADPYPNDPFFKRKYDTTWNACIGRQGHEENYLDGYIEAAIELASAVIDKKMFGKRDTLVLPILHNARHVVELSLKFVHLMDKTNFLHCVQLAGTKLGRLSLVRWLEQLERAEHGRAEISSADTSTEATEAGAMVDRGG